MKKILFISFILLIAVSYCGRGQTTNFSFTAKPYTDAEINSPGRGAHYWLTAPWNNNSAGGYEAPQVPNGTNETGAAISYMRWRWRVLETSVGVYDFNNTTWPNVAWWIRDAIANGKELYLGGVMPVDQSSNNLNNTYQGGYCQYPNYLWDSINLQMPSGQRNFLSADLIWVPNWNAPVYLRRLEILIDTLYKFIRNYSYNGKSGADVLRMADIRGYGNFGEWHDFTTNGRYYQEAGYQALRPTIATLKAIVDIHTAKMPHVPLTIIADAFNPNPASSIPVEVAQYILDATNTWGPVGWRRDNISNPGVDNSTILNPGKYQSRDSLKIQIRERWKYAPISGEPWKGGGLNGGYSDIAREQPLYHYFGFGNGNYAVGQITPSDGGAIGEEMRGYFKKTGYRYNWISGYMTTNPIVNQNMSVQLRWANVNGVPLYDKNWTVKYKIKNTAGTVVQTFSSAIDLFLFYSADSTVTETFVPTVTCTNCSLVISIEDDRNYSIPIKVAMNTPARNSDGSYTLRSGFNIAVSGASAPPVSAAGADQVLANGVTSGSVSGSGSTDDVAITAYLWTQVSGPNTAGISTPTTVGTNLTGMITGTYVFRLTVTDGDAQSTTDDVSVRINALPVSNAGADQSLANGTTTTTLSGTSSSDADGTITTYAWTQLTGTAATIVSASAATTDITGMVTGTMTFKLVVTDNNSATTNDTVQVVVNSGAVSGPNIVAFVGNSATNGTCAVTLNSVTAGNLLVLTIAQESDAPIPNPTSVTSSPSLTWTKRVDAQATQSGNAEIYTAVFTAGGNITVTTVWTVALSTTLYSVSNFNTSLNTSGSTGTGQTAPSVNITTSEINGMIFAVTSDYSAVNGSSRTYRDAPTERLYHFVTSQYTAYHYTKVAATAATYTEGLTAPATQKGGTALYVVRGSDVGTNQVPVPVAGTDQSWPQDTVQVTLNGRTSSDPDGTLTDTLWTQVSGPLGSLVITNPTKGLTTVTNMLPGLYVFRLEVTDNNAVKAIDEVTIFINSNPNSRLGNHKNVYMGTGDSIRLDGYLSYDYDSTTITYLWEQVSGTAATIETDDSVSTKISGLSTLGQRVFKLTVTDINGGTGIGYITVNVIPAITRSRLRLTN